MKFSCDSKVLAYALNKCGYVARIDKTYPTARAVKIEATQGVLGDTLVLTATDMNTTATFYVTDVEVQEEGESLVDAGIFKAVVSSKHADVRAHTTPKGKLSVSNGGNRTLLNKITGYFPDDESLPAEPMATIQGGALSDLLSIAFMAREDNAMPVLSGTLLATQDGTLYAMAASQGRMGYAWTSINFNEKSLMLLHPSTARVLPHFLYDDDEVKMYVTESNKVAFVTPRFKLVGRELASKEKYPFQYAGKMATAAQDCAIYVNATSLKEALQTCLTVSQGESNVALQQIHFAANKDDYRLLDVSTSEESEVGHMNLVMTVKKSEGPSFEFSLNALFMKEVLRAIEKLSGSEHMTSFLGASDNIKIGLSDPAAESGTGWIYMSSENLKAIFVVAPVAKKTVVHAP